MAPRFRRPCAVAPSLHAPLTEKVVMMNWSSQTKEIVHTESLEASPEAVEAAQPAGKAMASAELLTEAALLFLKALFPPPAEDVPALLDCFFALMDLN